MILDDIVEKLGGWDKLSRTEKETYKAHLKIIEKKSLSSEDIKGFVRRMITILETQLVDSRDGTNKSRGLKARLKNFLVLEAFLFGPERAKEALERYYKNMDIK